MDYNLCTAEDFAADESFIDWYLKKDTDHMLFWDTWISHHPEKLDEIYNAERILDLMFLKLNEAEFSEELANFSSFLGKSNDEKDDFIATRKSYYLKGLIVIFSLVSLSALSWYFIKNYNFQNTDQLTYQIRQNPSGQRSIFQLSDGTRVTLNANSYLRFPENFDGKTREVELKGEAYFEVTKNPKQPFLVKSENITTTVLGTSFDINTQALNETLNISLVEGLVKISITNKKGLVFLKPNQAIIYNKSTGALTKTAFNVKEITSWKDGVLYFNHASFEEIAQRMKTIYGITLQKNTEKLNWDYTGEFKNTDYLTVIRSICFAKKLRYQIVKDTIIIKK